VVTSSRSPNRPALVLLVSTFLCFAGSRAVVAQTDTKSAPSPVAPGGLSKPVFDTKTPVYDPVAGLDNAASNLVAEVEGRPITMGDVGDAIRALPPGLAGLPFETLYPTVLEQLIQQQALVVHAQRLGVDEEPTIRRKVRSAGVQQLAEEYMRRELAANITEEALLNRYNRDIAGRPGEEEVKARVILTDTEQEAVAVIAELRGGADFALVARRTSKDTTAAGGGDLGFNPRERMSPEVGAVAFALPPGQVAPYPVRGTAGWFVVKVEERRQEPTPAFASVRDQLKQIMLREGVAALAAAAVQDLKVRRYNFTGTEIEVEKPEER
jgi:peptidyl-prolyl cis-trans isomerase C